MGGRRVGRRSRAVRMSEDVENCSLYFGLTGMALALRSLDRVLGDSDAGTVGAQLLGQVRDRFDDDRWGDAVDLLGGNAGIALAALACSDEVLADLAVAPFLLTAEPTAAGVT